MTIMINPEITKDLSAMELIKQLREITMAGMKDCSDAIKQSNGDLQAAIDLIKIRGQNIANNKASQQALEGVIVDDSFCTPTQDSKVLVEVNSQTDFTARNPNFINFANLTAGVFLDKLINNQPFSVDDVETERQQLVSSTKENIVVRRWVAEESTDANVKVFSYLHSNKKIGVLLSMLAPNEEVANSKAFNELGNDIAMQICAMSPVAISADRIPVEEVDRQTAIFQTQLKEEGKPEAMWDKILQGKISRWHKDVCLLDQASVIVSKASIRQVIEKLNKDIRLVNFHHLEVGK